MGHLLVVIAAAMHVLGQPIVKVTFDGNGCPSGPTARAEIAQADSLALFENFQVNNLQEKKSCQVYLDLDLTNLCLNGGEITNTIGSALAPNARGLLITRSFIDGLQVGTPLSLTISGAQAPFNQQDNQLLVPGKKYCGKRATLLLDSTLEALDKPVQGNLLLISQRLNLAVTPWPTSIDSGPLNYPVTFSGAGCPPLGTMVNQDNWKLSIGYQYFSTRQYETECQVYIPLNLHGGCLLSMLASTSMYNRPDVSLSIRFLVNGQNVNWQYQRDRQQGNLDSITEFQNPYRSICGENIMLTALVSLSPFHTSTDTQGGAITSQIFEVRTIGAPKFYSGQEGPTAAFWLIPLVLLTQVSK